MLARQPLLCTPILKRNLLQRNGPFRTMSARSAGTTIPSTSVWAGIHLRHARHDLVVCAKHDCGDGAPGQQAKHVTGRCGSTSCNYTKHECNARSTCEPASSRSPTTATVGRIRILCRDQSFRGGYSRTSPPSARHIDVQRGHIVSAGFRLDDRWRNDRQQTE